MIEIIANNYQNNMKIKSVIILFITFIWVSIIIGITNMCIRFNISDNYSILTILLSHYFIMFMITYHKIKVFKFFLFLKNKILNLKK